MTGLALANTIQEADERAHLASQLEAETEAMLSSDASRPAADDGQMCRQRRCVTISLSPTRQTCACMC